MTSRIAVAGIHEYPARVIPDKSVLQLKAECASKALEDAGLTWADVDAVYDAMEAGTATDPTHLSGLHINEYMGFRPKVFDTTAVGGSSYEAHVDHAVRDLLAGRAKVAVLTYGSIARSAARRPDDRAFSSLTPNANLETPFGLSLVGNYALVAQRHMAQFGTTAEQLAHIAMTCRHHALRNPVALDFLSRGGTKQVGPLSVEAVRSSKQIADPLNLLDCCLITDGAGAVVLVAPDVVPDIRPKPVWVLGTGVSPKYLTNTSDITVSGAVESGKAAFGSAGIRPSEIDVAMMYDSFTITVLVGLEDLGFCAKGEGGSFVENGALNFDSPGGLALNTDGGGLSSNHPGMRGIFLLIEAVRQLRGESTSQVDDAKLAVAHGNGGQLGGRHVAATVVLAAD